MTIAPLLNSNSDSDIAHLQSGAELTVLYLRVEVAVDGYDGAPFNATHSRPPIPKHG
jgi:hypothetical protein